jgi:predicted RNA binding protein YcfA (HicA-like mRNA interferase family)
MVCMMGSREVIQRLEVDGWRIERQSGVKLR